MGLAILLGIFAFCVVIGTPVAFALGISAIAAFWWEGLPLMIGFQRIVSGMEAALLQRQLWKEREAASQEKVMAAGVQFNEISNKVPFQEAMASVYEAYLEANPDLRGLVELIQNTD